MEKAHLTLYTVIGSPQHILTGIQSLFAPVIEADHEDRMYFIFPGK